jgi:D-3-phosphoglycerate dehydrogenase / 2-oxoglutarate reductase
MKEEMLILHGEPMGESIVESLNQQFRVIFAQADPPTDVHVIKYVWVNLSIVVDRFFLDKFPNLKVLVLTATGHTTIDTKLLAKRNITLVSLRGHKGFLETISSSSEHAWALLLAGNSKLVTSHLHVKSGLWDKTLVCKQELQGKTLGIIGLGRIGKYLADYGRVFKMEVIGYDPYIGKESLPQVKKVGNLVELLRQSDHVILSASTSEVPEQILGPHEIFAIKPGAGLVNIARGSLVNEEAILRALDLRILNYFATDVLQDEDFQYLIQPRKSFRNELLNHDNVIMTPHIGGYSLDARERCDRHLANFLIEGGCDCDQTEGS